jgi:hypothetical protein
MVGKKTNLFATTELKLYSLEKPPNFCQNPFKFHDHLLAFSVFFIHRLVLLLLLLKIYIMRG